MFWEGGCARVQLSPGCEVVFSRDGVYNEAVVAHVSRVSEHAEWRELNKAEAAVVSRARQRTLERRQARLRLERLDDVVTGDGVV